MNDARPVRVFISYAQSSAAHGEAVRRLWALLRGNGVDARLDLPATAERRDWPLWMTEQIRAADFVIVVASGAYRRRAEESGSLETGRGVQFEAALLRENLYSDRGTWVRKLLPVLLPGETSDGLPAFLGPASCTTYGIHDLSAAGLEPLLRVITGQPAHVAHPLGAVPVLAPRPPEGGGSSPAQEMQVLVDAFLRVPEFATATGRSQALLLLPPEIRGSITEAPSARMHLVAIFQGCARFGEAGRAALLDILGAVLPSGDPGVRAAVAVVRSARLFGGRASALPGDCTEGGAAATLPERSY